MRHNVFTSVFVGFILSFSAVDLPAQDAETDNTSQPRFPSPNGRYGMLLTEDPSGDAEKTRIELVELATKRVLAELREEDDWPDAATNANLEWSKDSTRVAAYKGGRRGGTTRLFVREGDGFVEVKLPELPVLPDEESAEVRKKHPGGFGHAITIRDLDFVRWLKSGVILDLRNCWSGPTGSVRHNIRMTFEIDAQHKARITSVERKETFDKD
jgi:hypothetical protein